MDRTIGGSNPSRAKIFLQNFQTGSGAHLASYSVGTGSSFPGRAMRLTIHLHLMLRLRMVELYL
jgi:hypothetical protein